MFRHGSARLGSARLEGNYFQHRRQENNSALARRGDTPLRREWGLLRLGFSLVPIHSCDATTGLHSRSSAAAAAAAGDRVCSPHTRRLYPSLGINSERSFQFAHQSVCGVAAQQQPERWAPSCRAKSRNPLQKSLSPRAASKI